MIALGTLVTFHHRAAVARYTNHGWKTGRVWALYEGARKKCYSMPGFVREEDLFAKAPEIKSRRGGTINKTVMVWPEDGSGVVIGKVRRARGISQPSSGGGEDFDPGYFDALEYFTLYAVKIDLQGLEYILVPEWALTPAREAA